MNTRRESNQGSSSSRWQQLLNNKPSAKASLSHGKGILHKLFKRQCQRAPPSGDLNAIRLMCKDIYPSKMAVASQSPDVHIRGFTTDGKYLICFSSDLQSVLLYRYKGLSSKPPDSKHADFEKFFTLVWKLQIAADQHLLCKTFSLTMMNCKFLMVASSTQVQQNNPNGPPVTESTTFHIIDLVLGVKCDEHIFSDDFIWLAQNNGVSMYDDLFAVLSIRKQTIHIFQLSSFGKFIKIRSIGEYMFEDDEYELSKHEAEEEQFCEDIKLSSKKRKYASDQGEHREGCTNSKNRPYSGITQRILAYLAKEALRSGSNLKSNDKLKHFYFQFDDFEKLAMWKMQFLDRNHFLIKFDTSASNLGSQSVNSRYWGVLDAKDGSFVSLALNGSEELADLYEKYTDFFRVAIENNTWSRYVSSYYNDQFLRAQLSKQKDRFKKTHGSSANLFHQMSAFLPLSPQMTIPSPYLDTHLFQFDDRYVSPCNCPRPVADHAIKFLVRGKHSITRFKLDPLPIDDEEDDYHDHYVTYIFHPVYPFIMSCLCNDLAPMPRVLKFYYR